MIITNSEVRNRKITLNSLMNKNLTMAVTVSFEYYNPSKF